MTVKQFADKFGLWQCVEKAVNENSDSSVASFLQKIARIPVRHSRATRSLGVYVSKAHEPICIRLQFAQEPETLKQTFLHEVAHACDHLSRKRPQNSYRRAHGPAWKKWAKALGIAPRSTGESEAVRNLHQQRLKLIAVCQTCGAEFHRARRLSRNRTYVHNQCGGQLKTL
ncbi:MAG: SprT-like domain-containing protein [Deltaproteobacteria bacterium]|nr:SprT-like domain-containing protein [Deltaproteobacteria bacterium]MCW9050183.1 SprT-like domain-containing protein [Deltaproteobacteria bacterium]